MTTTATLTESVRGRAERTVGAQDFDVDDDVC
jgi:hypothetical protein